MEQFRAAGPLAYIAILSYGALALTAGLCIWHAAPHWVRRYTESPANSPKGWRGDRTPTVRNFRFGGVSAIVSGVIAFILGALLIADAVL